MFRQTNLRDAPEQKILLAFNENKLADFTTTVAPSGKVRPARLSGFAQIDANSPGGN